MQYKFSVWQVYYNNKVLVTTFETKQLALRHASEINNGGKQLAYVSEIKVYGGERDDN
ncbi:Uncharacterised protein [Macrococcoides caseolyticum]|uniref:hypothetical protein n=1 Tax=Macrococcoides caseolyticum TaxID=69966 RepID=UPI00116A0F0A|nr:hypothetical protein [Macrococcus caseolyticus]VUC68942.1 Uncharacterised protein [Macrococcus caseolyticus]